MGEASQKTYTFYLSLPSLIYWILHVAILRRALGSATVLLPVGRAQREMLGGKAVEAVFVLADHGVQDVLQKPRRRVRPVDPLCAIQSLGVNLVLHHTPHEALDHRGEALLSDNRRLSVAPRPVFLMADPPRGGVALQLLADVIKAPGIFSSASSYVESMVRLLILFAQRNNGHVDDALWHHHSIVEHDCRQSSTIV